VQAGDALGHRHAGGDLGHRERRRVRRQQRAGPACGGEGGEHLALELERLGRCLDHRVAARQAGGLRREREPGVADPPLGRFERARDRIVEDGGYPGGQGDPRDAGAHRAGARDAEARGHSRSTTIAWPWPPPTHMLSIP
jgi:hypothetical protein